MTEETKDTAHSQLLNIEATVTQTEDGKLSLTVDSYVKLNHIVNCVNSHESLVDALKQIQEIAASPTGVYCRDMKNAWDVAEAALKQAGAL